MAVAKRNANDRNEKAIQAARRKSENMNEHVLADGFVIKLKDIDPLFLQSVIGSVKHPKKPTYTVKLASGREEFYPMDALVAEQSPELKPLWDQYILDRASAQGLEMQLMTRAILLDGTEINEGWSDSNWERRMRIIGVTLPDDPEERWVFYLESKMSTAEIVGLTGKIMRRTGVPEEFIVAAEDSFRNPVDAGPAGAGDVDDVDGHSDGVAGEEAGEVAS